MRKLIYNTVHVYDGNRMSVAYKYLMIAAIILSLIPLTYKEKLPVFAITEIVCLVLFLIDYLLRWFTADYKFGCHSWTAFAHYPFRMISIIDLLSILALISSVTLEPTI